MTLTDASVDEFLQTFLTDWTLKPRRRKRFLTDWTSWKKIKVVNGSATCHSFAITTYIARQQMRLSGENDCENLTSRQRFTECQYEMVSDSFHHLNSASKLIVGQVEHCSWRKTVNLWLRTCFIDFYLFGCHLRSRSHDVICQLSTCIPKSFPARPRPTWAVVHFHGNLNCCCRCSCVSVLGLDDHSSVHHSSSNPSRRRQAVERHKKWN